MNLSVICANVYADYTPIEFLFKNLAQQSFRDIEIVLVDAFYEENLNLVKVLSKAHGFERVVHTPACEAKHIGRVLHWELYNNAALFANGDWLLFHGVHRYLHRSAMETVYRLAERDTCAIFAQQREEIGATRPDDPAELERIYSLDVEQARWQFLQHSGFFSVRRDVLIEKINGYNEAIVNVHWVDCDMGARVYHLPLNVVMLGRAMLRMERQGHYGVDESRGSKTVSGIGKPVCTVEENPVCVRLLREYGRLPESKEGFDFEGYMWYQCSKCGTLEIHDSDKFIQYLMDRCRVHGPVNIHGVGRHLARVAHDLAGKTLEEKIAIVSSSHTDPNYLAI